MANITIKEGGRAYSFAPAKLRTLLSGGGEALWVPENAITREELSVTENGDYRAAAEGLYAYSRVSVNVAQSDHVSGKGTDGNDYNYTVDPNTGQLVRTKIPSSIRVVTPPDNPYGIYTEGQTIGTVGMVVKAYDADGNEMITVPNREITLEPSVAVYDESTDAMESVYEEHVCLYRPGNEVAIGTNVPEWEPEQQFIEEYTATGEGPFYIFGTRYTSAVNSGLGGFICSPNEFIGHSETYGDGVYSYTYNGQTVYYYGRNAFQDSFYPYVNAPTNEIRINSDWGENNVAWVICYGTQSGVMGSHQTITAKWPRTGDGEILTDTFEILVAPSPSTGDN